MDNHEWIHQKTDWWVESDGQRLVLDYNKVAAEIERLRDALSVIADGARTMSSIARNALT